MASRSLLILACLLFTLFLHASSIRPVQATTASKPGGGVIRIWFVGSPHTNALPPAVVPQELRQRAQRLGYTIETEAFRASGFAARFHEALQSHSEPEILTFDNYGVLMGMKTVNGWIEGIDWDRRTAASLALVHETMASLQSQGWVMLVRSAANYEAARTLSMRPAECDARYGAAVDTSTIEPALRDAQEKAVSATRAYFDCDRSTLAAISHESRLVQQCYMPLSETKAKFVKACNVSGNQKLAFVSLVGNFSAEVRDPRALLASRPGMELGQRSILAVLTNESGTWRLLAITHDVLITTAQFPLNMNKLAKSLDQGLSTGLTPEAARLLTPDGVHPMPQGGERFGDFIWQPSASTDVIGQVVEFMWGKETNWGLTRVFFVPASQSKLSSGYLMSGGLAVWRVWTISKSGAVVFSEQHTFKNCPYPGLCARI